MIPRPLFGNQLKGLTTELQALERIIRTFSEVSTGSVEEVEVRQISTSDPMFFFGLSLPVIIALGTAVTWSLDTWKKVEEIRNLRAQTAAINGTNTKPLIKNFDKLIEDSIDSAVDEKLTELLKGVRDAGRKNELESSVDRSLRGILARVERGMTVEIKVLPPLVKATAEGEKQADPPKTFQSLKHISSNLVFPEFAGEPISKLPPPPAERAAPTRKASPRKRAPSKPKDKT